MFEKEDKPKDDDLGNADDVLSKDIPSGVDRRTFLMRSAVVGATAIMKIGRASCRERVSSVV